MSRCLRQSTLVLHFRDNWWLVHCSISGGMLAVQAWPRATNHTHEKIISMRNILVTTYKEAPLAINLFDVIFDRGTLFLCMEYCSNGSLQNALNNCQLSNHIGWLVSQVC
jgi:serine/threonine protein kinase